jgi:hypothetical protein
MTTPQQQQINIELGDAEAQGTYANMAMIHNSPTEMILDFARIMPRTPKAKVVSRIIMTPMHAKLLQQTLAQNIKKHEEQFGEIKIHHGAQPGSKPIGFETNSGLTGESE